MLQHTEKQGWDFAMAKTVFARTVEKQVKTMVKTGKNWQLALCFSTIWALFVLFVLLVICVCIKAISEP